MSANTTQRLPTRNEQNASYNVGVISNEVAKAKDLWNLYKLEQELIAQGYLKVVPAYQPRNREDGNLDKGDSLNATGDRWLGQEAKHRNENAYQVQDLPREEPENTAAIYKVLTPGSTASPGDNGLHHTDLENEEIQ